MQQRQSTKIKLIGGAGATGATGVDARGHGTTASGDGRRVVAAMVAADQVEAGESLLDGSKTSVVSCIVGVQTYSSLVRLSSLTNSENRGVLFVFSN